MLRGWLLLGLSVAARASCPAALAEHNLCCCRGSGIHTTALREITLAYLRDLLQTCIEIEHSTIPLYLTALYSNSDTTGWAYNVTRGVAVEEMLHMTHAANVLNAIGGTPSIDHPAFVPEYPIVIPVINITSHVGSFSKRTVYTFEKIEADLADESKSITATYKFVADSLAALVKLHGEAAVFSGDPKRQVVAASRGGEQTFAVTTLEHAVAALVGVSDQGSGMPTAQPPGFNLSAGPLGGGLAQCVHQSPTRTAGRCTLG